MLQCVTEYEMTDLFFIANLLTTMNGQQTVKPGHITMAAAIKRMDPQQRGLHIHSQVDFHRVLAGLGFDLTKVDLGTRLNIDTIAPLAQKVETEKKRKRDEAEDKRKKKKAKQSETTKPPDDEDVAESSEEEVFM
jgi:hypothetical protein